MHREAREGVGVEGLVVNLVHGLVEHLGVEQSVGPVEVEVCPHVHEGDPGEEDGHGHGAVVVDEETGRPVGGQVAKAVQFIDQGSIKCTDCNT